MTEPTLTILPEIKSPEFIVFSDLDETYLAHEQTPGQRKSRLELDSYLAQLAKEKKVLFCWVTGSSMPSVEMKIRKYALTTMPHFLCAGMGSEVVIWDETCKDFKELTEWRYSLPYPDLNLETIDTIVDNIREQYGADIEIQSELAQGKRKRSYHLNADNPHIDKILGTIQHEAQRYHMNTNRSACNPGAGDPAGYYDIDFVPEGCNKLKAAEFVAQYCSVPQDNTFYFGDSGNDIELLRWAKHSTLVANATPEAQQCFDRISQYPYTDAILHELKAFFR